jgi:hypothetical protein
LLKFHLSFSTTPGTFISTGFLILGWSEERMEGSLRFNSSAIGAGGNLRSSVMEASQGRADSSGLGAEESSDGGEIGGGIEEGEGGRGRLQTIFDSQSSISIPSIPLSMSSLP